MGLRTERVDRTPGLLSMNQALCQLSYLGESPRWSLVNLGPVGNHGIGPCRYRLIRAASSPAESLPGAEGSGAAPPRAAPAEDGEIESLWLPTHPASNRRPHPDGFILQARKVHGSNVCRTPVPASGFQPGTLPLGQPSRSGGRTTRKPRLAARIR